MKRTKPDGQPGTPAEVKEKQTGIPAEVEALFEELTAIHKEMAREWDDTPIGAALMRVNADLQLVLVSRDPMPERVNQWVNLNAEKHLLESDLAGMPQVRRKIGMRAYALFHKIKPLVVEWVWNHYHAAKEKAVERFEAAFKSGLVAAGGSGAAANQSLEEEVERQAELDPVVKHWKAFAHAVGDDLRGLIDYDRAPAQSLEMVDVRGMPTPGVWEINPFSPLTTLEAIRSKWLALPALETVPSPPAGE